MNLPFSQACENNKQSILAILQTAFRNCSNILEIGTGTAQHAAFFAEQMPWLIWHCSDQADYIDGINARCEQAQLANLRKPFELDVRKKPWPTCENIDGVFSANTCHIMSWSTVEIFIQGVSEAFTGNGVFCLYGPFNYNNAFTSNSNAQFDLWLKQRDPLAGIRDQEAITALAVSVGLHLENDFAMPANNRLLVFKKTCSHCSL